MIKFATKIAALSLLLALAGCGGEPSEDDIRQALQPMYDGVNAEAPNVGNNARAREMLNQLTLKLESVKKHTCAKENIGYRCDVTITAKRGNRSESGPASLRLTKGDKGWMVVQ